MWSEKFTRTRGKLIEGEQLMSQPAHKRDGIPAMLKDTAFVWEDPLDLESELTEHERIP